MFKIQIIITVISLSFLFFVIELIRRNRLREQYALLWILTGITIVAISVWPQLLSWLSYLTGMYYLSIIIVVSFIFLLTIVLHYSVVISSFSEKIIKLSQQISILNYKLEKLERESLKKQ